MINLNYMSKKLFLVALTILAVSTAAFAQGAKNVVPGTKAEKFYQVVPEHEFTVNGFFGASTLLYKVNAGYAAYNDDEWVHDGPPAMRYQKSDFVNFSNGPFHPTGFGGGGGFGYIWHFHPNFGLMTGLDIAYYSGGVRNICGGYKDIYWDGGAEHYREYDRPFFTGYIDYVEMEDATQQGSTKKPYLFTYGVNDYTEMQKYLALQIPIMFQFMAPMGQGNNHFYAAVGARIGFGIWNNYKGMGKEIQHSYINPDFPYSEAWTPLNDGGNWDKGFWLLEEAGGDMSYWEPEEGDYSWWIKGEDVEYPFRPSGKWGAKLVNVMASAEIGFRWRLTDGLGLYTGIYCDYGITSINKKQNVALVTGQEGGKYDTHSVMNTQTATGMWVDFFETDPPSGHVTPDVPGQEQPTYYIKKYRNEPLQPSVKGAHTLGLGLKVKLAFGKVLPTAPPAPPVLPKPDTVVKTIIIRDTVQNTVVVRDTVTNTVVVRDTVTIIKEIPVEIQQTMRDLSNTLFEFDKFNLGEKARGYLDEVVEWLVQNPKVNVEIGGHTDSYGSQEYNQKLSENRAKAVYNYFVEHGVNKDRLSYKGYGKMEPIADNKTDAGRQQNRRVELKIVNN